MRFFAAFLALFVLVSCEGRDDFSRSPEPIGDFLLGYSVAVAPNLQKGPFSRNATEDEWTTAVQQAVMSRFGEERFSGNRYFHIGVSVDGYVLAAPGVPLVYTPKSVLIITVNFWEDATQEIINGEPIQLTVFEPCCAPIIGSGIARSREEQLEGLAFNAARAIERTMRQNAQWFGGTPENLPQDDTIMTGNVLTEDPSTILPEQTPPS